VGERQKGAALPTLRAFELRTLHPALSTLSVELERLLASIRRHPLRVVHAGAGWAKPVFDPSELLVEVGAVFAAIVRSHRRTRFLRPTAVGMGVIP
jgi:hypothetical protein